MLGIRIATGQHPAIVPLPLDLEIFKLGFQVAPNPDVDYFGFDLVMAKSANCGLLLNKRLV